jgi:hypothetical protein
MPGSEAHQSPGSERDAQVAAILGVFFVVLALPVLIGTGYAEIGIDRAINLVSGLLVLSVGLGFLGWARRLARRR